MATHHLVTPDGTVKVLDFGIAKLLQSEDAGDQLATLSRQNTVLGTVNQARS